MLGMLFGSFFYGLLGDRLGRRTTLTIAVVNACVAGMSGAFVDSYLWYTFTRLLTGVGKRIIKYK